MAKKTRKPQAPKDDESDPEAKAGGLLIGPIPYELIGLYEKLGAVDRPLELLSLLRQLLDEKWPNDKIMEIMEAKIAELENARTMQETPPAPDQG